MFKEREYRGWVGKKPEEGAGPLQQIYEGGWGERLIRFEDIGKVAK